MNSYNKKYKVGLAIFAACFVVISISFHIAENYFWFRLIRGIFCYSILAYLLFTLRKDVNKWVVGFLTFNGASCFAMVWYENDVMASISMILGFISILFVFWHVIPGIKIQNFNKRFTFLFILILLFNGYLFIQLIESMRSAILTEAQYNFMLLSSIGGSLLGFFALFNNHIYNTPQSMSFMILVLLLIFSGVLRAIGYYNLETGLPFMYVARLLYALAISVLVHYSFLDSRLKRNLAVAII